MVSSLRFHCAASAALIMVSTGWRWVQFSLEELFLLAAKMGFFVISGVRKVGF
jgi:hypothetical protein